MPGEDKVTSFLALRRTVMKTYNLEDTIIMEKELSEIIFKQGKALEYINCMKEFI